MLRSCCLFVYKGAARDGDTHASSSAVFPGVSHHWMYRKGYPLPDSKERRVTPEQVFEVLETCYDPCCKERSVSVVELGLIQGVQIAENGHDVRVELLLTSGWCPFSTHLLQMIQQELARIEEVGEVDTEIVWHTTWTPERMSPSARAKLSLPMAQLLPLRRLRLEREARASQAST